jgi:hypothetical protein
LILRAHLHPAANFSASLLSDWSPSAGVSLCPGTGFVRRFFCDLILPSPPFGFAIENIRRIKIGMDPNFIQFCPSTRICRTSPSHAGIDRCFCCRIEFLIDDRVFGDLS